MTLMKKETSEKMLIMSPDMVCHLVNWSDVSSSGTL